MIEFPDGERWADYVNASQVKVRFQDGKWWYKPYPFPKESN